jgi:threonine dehydrogenase-like Zn-dependent dehydrogenase
MKTARAAVLEQSLKPLQIRHFPLPSPPLPQAALVRTQMAGICGTDVHLWKGDLPIQLPVILGHETVGVVEELGPEFGPCWNGEALQVGDRITWNSTVSCGNCYYCADKHQPTRCPHRRAYGIGYPCDVSPHFLGGYAQYHYLLPKATVFKLAPDLATESVIGAGCALITAIHGVERICMETAAKNPENSEKSDGMPVLPSLWQDCIVIQGAGPVGIAALAVARNAGAQKIIVIGGPPHRLQLARRFGADHVISMEEYPEAADRIQQVLDLTGGHGADVVLECVGHPSAMTEGVEMCRDGAKYLVLGHYCDAGSRPFNPHLITRKQLQVVGSWSSEPRHLQAALHFLNHTRDSYPFHEMVTHRFGLEEADQALATTARWESAKSVIVP